MYTDKITYLLILLNETFFAKCFMNKCKEKHILVIQIIFQNPFDEKKISLKIFILSRQHAGLPDERRVHRCPDQRPQRRDLSPARGPCWMR